MVAKVRQDRALLDDMALAELVARRDPQAVRLVTQRNNQRLFRAAWSIVKNDADAEDAVQSGYMRAFGAIESFEGRSSLSTWLTRIVVNEALGRQRASARRQRNLNRDSVAVMEDYREKLMRGSTSGSSPEAEFLRSQLRARIEAAVAELPLEFRTVFILRDVEGSSVAETAQALDLPEATVKTRCFRARQRIRRSLAPEMREVLSGSFPFAGARCERITEDILRKFCG